MPIGDLTAASIERELRAACLELEQRFRSGEEYSAEQLLALYPKLRNDPDSALEVIFAEFVLRRQRGEPISPEQWYERFPQWRERLERLLHVYEIMGAEASLATGVLVDTVQVQDPLSTLRSPAHQNRRIGSYELLEEIARGGMGVVYKARHSGLKRIVAFKLILAGEHAGAEQRARFRQEAEAAARLQHPNIVQIFEIGQEGNLPFLAMEYVDGPPLDQYLSRRRAEGSVGLLPARQAAELVECLARAMHHAHQQGVVHRDLKPANVLLANSECGMRNAELSETSRDAKAKSDSSGDHSALRIPNSEFLPKITDFGLAKILNDSQLETRMDLLLGTPSYMAPEQAAGRPADIGPATDVFALGVILYELLTGYLPFQGTSVGETLQQVRWVEPIPPSQLQRSVPRDLQTICLKCLQKEPTRRYGSAEALAEDLRRFLRDEPILARPVGRTERAWRWCRRNKAVAALAGGIALLLVSGTTLSTSLAVWALNEKAQATVSARQAQNSTRQEREARALADHRFAQAEKAVEDYLDGIENNDRLKEADFLGLRKQLLTSAVPFYEDFVKQKPTDARLKFKRGKAHLRLGTLHDVLGEHDQALADFNQMQEIFQELVSEYPKVPEYRRELATGHNNLGVLLRKLGKQEAAEAQYRSALAIFEQLTADFLNDPGYRNDLARTHGNLANLLGRTVGGRDEAAEHHVQAITLRKQLTEEFPKLPEYREGLASAHQNFGSFFHERQKRQEAEAEYRQAFLLHERLAAEFPSDPRYRLSLAMSQRTMGD